MSTTKKELTARLAKMALNGFIRPEKVSIYKKFFKTGPGEYAEGDQFIGVVVPDTRKVAKLFADLALNEIKILLTSKIHEERLLAIIILVNAYRKNTKKDQDKIICRKIFNFYYRHLPYINNWDLVDVSARDIIGHYLFEMSSAVTRKKLLQTLSSSKNLWKRRVAMIATFYFIHQHSFEETLKLCRHYIHDKEDLIHKASGWMLREIGKTGRDGKMVLDQFVKQHAHEMPSIMLSYAIEHYTEGQRQEIRKNYRNRPKRKIT